MPQTRGTRIMVAATGACAALVAAASFLPSARLWGLNHLAFYPVPVRIVALAIVAMAFIPGAARTVWDTLRAIGDSLARLGEGRFRAIAIAGALAAFALFFAFRSATNLLGDGQLIARSFEAAAHGNKKVVMRSVPAIVKEEDIAPGATILYYVAAKWAVMFKHNPVDGIRVFNCLLGCVWVFFLLLVLRRARLETDLKPWLLVLGLFSASIELFYGYVENYTPLVFFLILYAITALLCLHRRANVGWPIAFFTLAVYTHIQAWVFGPSLLFLVVWRFALGRRRIVLRYVPPILLAFTVLGVAGAYFTNARRYLLPLYRPGEYAIVSPAHLADIANELFLLMPILPLVAVLAWLGRSAWRALPETERKLEADTWLAHPVEWHFVTLMLVPTLCYLVAFDPEIGMARDWDLFGMFSVALVPYVLLVVARYLRATATETAVAARFSAPALVLVMVLGVAWIGINTSPWRTADRFESILGYDRSHGSYAWENLAIFYHESGRLDRATLIMEHTYETWHNPRHAVRLAVYYEEAGRSEDATRLMYNVLDRYPRDNRSRTKLVMLLDRAGRWSDMVPVAREGTELHPQKPSYWFYLGESLIQTGEIPEGLQAFLRCLEHSPPTSARQHIQKRFEEYGRPDREGDPDQ